MRGILRKKQVACGIPHNKCAFVNDRINDDRENDHYSHFHSNFKKG
jgi:hypothetical protein